MSSFPFFLFLFQQFLLVSRSPSDWDNQTCSIPKIWWNSEGKISRELEYGMLLWEGFDINAFYEFWEDQAYEFPDGLLRNRLGTDRLLEETW